MSVAFNKKNFLEFILNFDYICKKYELNSDSDFYTLFSNHERMQQSVAISTRDYSSIYDNIKLIYGDGEDTHFNLYIYRLVKEKIINQFLNMPGLERMFDEHFFEFEWDMHSRLDFDKHNISFYRDHFIHQARNLYELFSFFDNKEFFESFRNDILNGNGRISLYAKQSVYKAVNNAINNIIPYFELRKKGNEEIMTCRNLLKEYYHSLHSLNGDQCDNRSYYEFLKDFYLNYIIKAAAALSALFHDIGYPILHYKKLKERISKFMPSMYMFFGEQNNGFEQIYALLCNSLLFRILTKEELFEAVCNGSNHGAVSAVAFLLAFYENGIICDLPIEKRTAVEIAAVVIYDHTLKYATIDKEDTTYYRPVYSVNPLSFLFRIYDDIQEWDRKYFEINDTPELIVCEKCGMPLAREKENKHNNRCSRIIYKCLSCKGRYMRPDELVRRKIIEINNCRKVTLSFSENKSREKYIKIAIQYEYWLLLEMCWMSPTFAKHRIKELNKLRKILKHQRIGNCNFALIDFNISPNPFVLKAAILGEMMNSHKKSVDNRIFVPVRELVDKLRDEIKQVFHAQDIDGLKSDTGVVDDTCKDAVFNAFSQFDDNITKILEGKDEYIAKMIRRVMSKNTSHKRLNRNCIINNLKFYLLLYAVSCEFPGLNRSQEYDFWHKKLKDKDGKETDKKVIDILTETLDERLNEFVINLGIKNNRYISEFISDALAQYSKLFCMMDDSVDENQHTVNCDEYYEGYYTEERIYNLVEKYSDIRQYERIEGLDFYSDIGFFYEMADYIKANDE